MSSVQSVERAFAVLRCLAGGPAGVSEVAERIALPKSTVSRLLSTLQDLGAVDQLDAGGDYRVGDLMIELAAGATPGRKLITVARAHLFELVEILGETAGLSMLDGEGVVYLDQVDADNPVQVRDWTGENLPAHIVPSGLVLMAHASTDVREAFLASELEAWTPKTMTDATELRRRLAVIAKTGSAWVYEEMSEGINSVASPVRNPAGMVVAAIHAHGPSYRFPAEGGAESVAAAVKETADRVTARLAGHVDFAEPAHAVAT